MSTVKLQSSDGHILKVDVSHAQELKKVRDMIEKMGADKAIFLPEVTGEILAKVMEYAKYHVEARKCSDGKSAVSEDKIKKWDDAFINVDRDQIYKLVLAASYLEYESLRDFAFKPYVDETHGTSQEVNNDDLTDEGREEFRQAVERHKQDPVGR